MSFHGIIEPETIDKLVQILNAHCDRYGIRSAGGRESVAASLMEFYERGVSDPLALVELLEREDSPDRRPLVEDGKIGRAGLQTKLGGRSWAAVQDNEGAIPCATDGDFARTRAGTGQGMGNDRPTLLKAAKMFQSRPKG